MANLYRIDNNPYEKSILLLHDIKKILKEDGDTNKKFKNEIYGYKLYELNKKFGNKYYDGGSGNIARVITKRNLESRYYIIVKVRAKMPVLCPYAEKFIFTKDELDKLMNTYYDIDMLKLRTMCLVNESIINFDTGMEIKKFPPGFKKELKLYAPIRATCYYGNYDPYTKLHKYVFPDYFEINQIECDHGLHFFISIKQVLEFFTDNMLIHSIQ